MTAAGELRERVAFATQFEIEDSPSGGITLSDWEDQFTASARIKFLVGTEPIIAQRLTGVQPVAITVRHSINTKRVDSSWRLRNIRTGEQFQIRSVTPDQRREFIDFLCEKGEAVG